MKRWSFAGLVFALSALLSFYSLAKGGVSVPLPSVKESPMPVKVLSAYTADELPRFPGRVEAGDSAVLAFRVGGQLLALKVNMGDRVERGAVLAELDPTDYRLNLDASQAEFDLARLESDRASTLYAQKLISEDQYDTARTMLATNQARLAQARQQLSFSKLTAPFAGVIAFTYAMPSEVVAPQQPILNLQDISTLEIQFNLPPRFQPLLEGANRAQFTVTFELMPGLVMDARYKEASMQPDPDTNSYPVTLLVDAPQRFSARPGMPVSVNLHHSSLLSRHWIPPPEALFEHSSGLAHVWRIEPASMTIQKVMVELDAAGALRSGLKPGDQIVAAGVGRLREGQRVLPWVREGGM